MSEFTGLARSFEALFSAPRATGADDEGSDGGTADTTTSPGGALAGGTRDEPIEPIFDDLEHVGSGPPELSSTSLGDDLLHEERMYDEMADVAPGAMVDVPPIEPAEVVAGPPEVFATEPLVAEEPIGFVEAPVDPPPPDASPPGPPLPQAPSTDPDEDDFTPSPLDLAVDDFVADESKIAEDILRLAADCLDRRELDPIARAVATLTLAAGDPPDERLFGAAEAVTSPMVLRRLAHHIGRERHEERREEYYRICRTIGAEMADAIRSDLADNTDRLARSNLCQALVEMGAPGREMIEAMAEDENVFLVRNAISILGEQGGDRAVALCTSALANPDARVRREALRALARLGDPESGAIIVGFLEDPDARVRIAAAVTAGELRTERAFRPLLAMLEATKDPDEVLPLVRALGRIGDPGAVVSIEKHATTSLFSRPRTDVRITAYRALNEIGTPHARRLLNQAIDDKDPVVKAAVKEILGLR